MALAESLEQRRIPFSWQVWAGVTESLTKSSTKSLTKALPDTPSSLPSKYLPTVLAIVPHYRCEPWLRRCLASLVNQTRPPDGIVVVDDGSPVPPAEIVAEFPSVTLLIAPVTVGPYRLVQQVIQDTHYDYYLFQDADDWSFLERLAQLLVAAEHTQADLIGTQELRWESEPDRLIPVHYPLDVNLALAEKPGHPLLHPTSLVRRQLVMAVGGFATGLHFGGDTEFLLRAAWVGRILNLPSYGYLRQKRPHSLTTNPQTGLDSSARQALLQALKQRAHQNRTAHQQGLPLDLSPLCQAPPIRLQHPIGPALVANQP
jgi:glycosyltransferase involved in cell wall biosynthesis